MYYPYNALKWNKWRNKNNQTKILSKLKKEKNLKKKQNSKFNKKFKNKKAKRNAIAHSSYWREGRKMGDEGTDGRSKEKYKWT